MLEPSLDLPPLSYLKLNLTLKQIFYPLGIVIFFTFLLIGLLDLRPIQASNDGLELESKSLIKPLSEPVATPKVEMAVIPVEKPKPVYTPPPQASGAVEGCGDDYYANWIYMHESGCRLDARNSQGCLGIGQACPGSKLTNVCPDLNYACQNSFFTGYVNARYGGWQGAYNFWQSAGWY